METIYGESPEISYEADGRVALYSIDDDPGTGTITGGSGQGGEQTLGGKILWEITRDEEGNISGGITGIDWMREVANSPFATFNDEYLWTVAYRDKNLNQIFAMWDADTGEQWTFAAYVATNRERCVSGNIF